MITNSKEYLGTSLYKKKTQFSNILEVFLVLISFLLIY
jgi:hypothetical protein